MKDKEMTELLAGTYQRQYHHNTYPELSDNSEFVTSKEEIKQTCMQMAAWKEQQMIEKMENFVKRLYLPAYPYQDRENEELINDIKEAMLEEE